MIEIVDLCLQAEHPEPEFIEEGNSFVVRLFSKRTLGAPRDYTIQDQLLTNRQKEILNILRLQEAFTLRTLIEQMTEPPKSVTVRKDLYVLKKKDYIDSKGHGRGASWYLKKDGKK